MLFLSIPVSEKLQKTRPCKVKSANCLLYEDTSKKSRSSCQSTCNQTMIIIMNQPSGNSEEKIAPKDLPSLWQFIILLIIFTFVAVSLFGLIVYLFIRGAEQLGLPLFVHIGIFVLISGVFAWLIKRISDMVSGMSEYWFPEDDEDDCQT